MRLVAYILLIVALVLMASFASDTKEQAFWKWFETNQDDLYNFEKGREVIFDRLAAAMRNVNGDLTFEFGPIRDDGLREFVISAGGITSAFPHVEALHAKAPKLSKWKFLKYRQRRCPINDLRLAGREVKSSDVHYAIFKDEDPSKLGVMIFLDGYTEENKDKVWAQIGFLFLDEALGEYDVATHVGAIVFFDRTSKYFQHARPLAELSSQFDERLGRKVEGEQATHNNP